MKKILLILLLLITTGCKKSDNDCTSAETETISKLEKYKVSLVAVGDNLIHEPIYVSAKTNDSYDFRSMFSKIKSYIRSFDLAFINQETILGGDEIGLSTYPRFNSPYELGDALVDTGFDLISIANNHTLDKGETGVLNAINYLDKQDVVYSGANKSSEESNVKIFEKNNIKFAFVAYTYGTNGIPHPEGKDHLAYIYSNEKAKEDIENLKSQVDVVIVSMHWGEEYQDYPSNLQKEQANYLSTLGVDIILGHHPHVIQPVDLIENNGHTTFVAYSLGNFLSDQIGIDRLIGMAISIDIIKNKDNDNIEISLENIKSKLTYRYFNKDEYSILFFENLNEGILPGYKNYLNTKRDLIQTYYKDIEVK